MAVLFAQFFINFNEKRKEKKNAKHRQQSILAYHKREQEEIKRMHHTLTYSKAVECPW